MTVDGEDRFPARTSPLWAIGLSIALGSPSSGIADVVLPDHADIAYTGRIDFSNAQAPGFGWPGTSLKARFEGTSIKATFDDDGDNYLYVIVDNGVPSTLALNSGQAQYTLAAGLIDAIHEIEIVKKTEGGLDDNFSFLGFELDAGKSLVAPPPRPPVRLEFYGDSNASGYSCECTCDSGDAVYRNNYFSFVGTTARMLDAEYSSISWSGIGIAVTSPKINNVWNRVLPTHSFPTWSFASYTPDAVIINLGANDYYWGASQAQLIQGWQNFVTYNLRLAYPDTHVCFVNSFGWAYDEPADYVHLAVQNLHAAGDTNVSYVLFPWLWGQQHAVICEQAGFANILAAHLANALGLPEPEPVDFSCLGEPGKLANGSFERGSATEIDGWRNFRSGQGAINVVENAGAAHSGARLIEVSSGQNGYAGFYQGTAAAPGSSYTVTGFMRATTGAVGRLKIEFKDQAQDILQAIGGQQTVTGDWALYSTTTGPAPPGTFQVTVVCVTDTPNNTVQFDDVALTLVGAPAGSGDFDGDTDVDFRDFAAFQICFGQLGTEGCAAGDMIGVDGMIDLNDFAVFVARMSNP